MFLLNDVIDKVCYYSRIFYEDKFLLMIVYNYNYFLIKQWTQYKYNVYVFSYRYVYALYYYVCINQVNKLYIIVNCGQVSHACYGTDPVCDHYTIQCTDTHKIQLGDLYAGYKTNQVRTFYFLLLSGHLNFPLKASQI